MLAIVSANGRISDPSQARRRMQSGDILIAANGGVRHCLNAGVRPDFIIGDLDSLQAAEIQALEEGGSQIVRHPQRKDATDLELALRYAAELACDQALVLGGMGGRWDQSIANLLLAAHPDLQNMRIRFLDGPQEAYVIRSGESLQVEGQPGDVVSLIPLAQEAAGITTHGLEYALEDRSLSFATSRGISNVMTEATANVRLGSGALLCVVLHGGAEAVESNEGG